ncbi:MFS transporter [Actinospica sp. MGRD01-02]|uniref:MFS transporter n=1 Tax=Actinospica acidithermotolerans TaxID=2828514 RepID=A0A941EE45_9ACTN|nr:MFS transporter [Actinospica acidithermotolerans]MBR7829831.1 MFS transporter [Actinospica acidithermotolerans]
MTATPTAPIDPAADAGGPTASADTGARRPFAWYAALPKSGRRAFLGAFGGYGLDAYDFQVLPIGLTAIAAYFHLSKGQAGLLTTVTLVVSAVGGIVAGVLIDRIGRSRTMMITIATYALFTALCGFAPNYPTLLTFRALQGLGFGGEWAAGAVLVAEYASARYRGRTVAFVQSSWAVGWALAVVVGTLALDHLGGGLAWRVLFWTGALPGLLLLFLRRNVSDAAPAALRRNVSDAAPAALRRNVSDAAPAALRRNVSDAAAAAPHSSAPARRQDSATSRRPLSAAFTGRLGRITLFAALMSTGVQGGYYTVATWLPTYLKQDRHLTVVGTGSYLSLLIGGAFLGYLCGGYLSDGLGRRKAIALFGILSGGILYSYIHIPPADNHALLLLGFPLGFCFSAIFSGFGSYLAELYPHAVRGTGQSFTYNVGRAVGAFFPTAVGFEAGSKGLGGALVYGTAGYALAVLALLGLPETRRIDLA